MKKKYIIIGTIIGIVLLTSIITLVLIDNCMYTGKSIKKVQKGCTYIIAATGEELKEGSEIPKPSDKDEYHTQDYRYVYYEKYEGFGCKEIEELSLSGWRLKVKNESITQEEYEKILGEIGNEQVIGITFYGAFGMKKAPKIPKGIVDMNNAFLICESLEVPPNIPEGVIDMTQAFERCRALKTPPKIPEGVVDLTYTFVMCENLTTGPNIPESVKYMNSTFYDCKNLRTVSRIPSSVVIMERIFVGCSNLTGEIVIDANIDERILEASHPLSSFTGVNLDNIEITGSSKVVEYWDEYKKEQ